MIRKLMIIGTILFLGVDEKGIRTFRVVYFEYLFRRL
jgi:hypothetical protein